MSVIATAALLRSPDAPFELTPVELDGLQPDEILVDIEACGICHTDIGSRHIVPTPSVLGHEGAGRVEAVGKAVTDLKPGDRVILSYGHCGHCPECESGQAFQCERGVEANFTGKRLDRPSPISISGEGRVSAAFFQQSSFATKAVALARSAVKVDTDLPAHALAPLGCGVLTGAGSVINTLGVRPGEPLGVWGAGAVGLSAILAGILVGANPLIAIDIVPSRLDLARELGATHTIDAREGDVASRLRDIAPRGLRHALETTSNEHALNDALASLGMGGTCGIVNVPRGGEAYPLALAPVFFTASALKGVFFGSSLPRTLLPRLIGLHEAGRFPFDRLIRTYPFAEINQAMADSENGSVIKPVLVMK